MGHRVGFKLGTDFCLPREELVCSERAFQPLPSQLEACWSRGEAEWFACTTTPAWRVLPTT